MYVAELVFEVRRAAEGPEAFDSVERLLSALWKNGQILDPDVPLVQAAEGFRVNVALPESGALNAKHHNDWVKHSLAELPGVGLAKPRVTVLGPVPQSYEADRCASPSSYILFSTYLGHSPALRCGDCFRPVPLYRIPHTEGGEYFDVLCWQEDYEACDHLQMNCVTGERFALREMSGWNSSLSKQGREVCARVQKLTAVPTYYYLFRSKGRARPTEKKRRCPKCGGNWTLRVPWHGFFDFRCDRCRLLSNVAWNVR